MRSVRIKLFITTKALTRPYVKEDRAMIILQLNNMSVMFWFDPTGKSILYFF